MSTLSPAYSNSPDIMQPSSPGGTRRQQDLPRVMARAGGPPLSSYPTFHPQWKFLCLAAILTPSNGQHLPTGSPQALPYSTGQLLFANTPTNQADFKQPGMQGQGRSHKTLKLGRDVPNRFSPTNSGTYCSQLGTFQKSEPLVLFSDPEGKSRLPVLSHKD